MSPDFAANDALRRISAGDLAHLGLEQLAYVRRLVIDDQPMFAVFAADGSRMGVVSDHATAIAAILANDLEPASVH